MSSQRYSERNIKLMIISQGLSVKFLSAPVGFRMGAIGCQGVRKENINSNGMMLGKPTLFGTRREMGGGSNQG